MLPLSNIDYSWFSDKLPMCVRLGENAENRSDIR
jgi:hypothetical protein